MILNIRFCVIRQLADSCSFHNVQFNFQVKLNNYRCKLQGKKKIVQKLISRDHQFLYRSFIIGC